MGFGLKVFNPNNEFVVSSDAKGLHCLGRASLYASAQPTGNVTGGYPGMQSGWSSYRIWHNGPILVAMDLPEGHYVAIEGVTEVAAGVWEIKMQHGDTLDSYGFITTQIQIDVWAYGFPDSQATGDSFGMALYDSAGNLSWDLSRPYPLWPRGNGVAPNGGAATIPVLNRPVVLGAPCTDWTSDQAVSTKHFEVYRRIGAWQRNGTTLRNALITRQHWEYSNTEMQGFGDGDVYDAPFFVLEGNYLP